MNRIIQIVLKEPIPVPAPNSHGRLLKAFVLKGTKQPEGYQLDMVADDIFFAEHGLIGITRGHKTLMVSHTNLIYLELMDADTQLPEQVVLGGGAKMPPPSMLVPDLTVKRGPGRPRKYPETVAEPNDE